MPKQVDHEQRRHEIGDALLRIASTRGVHAVGMRDVATEAGVSLRLVQYYFQTKQQLLLFALRRLGDLFGERVTARIRATGDDPPPRAFVEATLFESLPTDEHGRTLHIVYTAYHALALTNPTLAEQPFLADPDRLEELLVSKLDTAQQAGDIAAHLDTRAEAVGLLALSAGLGSSLLAGQRSADDARNVLRYHLDRLFQYAPEPAHSGQDTPRR